MVPRIRPFSISTEGASNKQCSKQMWLHKTRGSSVVSISLLLPPSVDQAVKTLPPSTLGPLTTQWKGPQRTVPSQTPGPQLIVLPAPCFGMPAALEGTVCPFHRCQLCDIIQFLLCSPWAASWVSATCPVPKTVKDLHTVSSENCLLLPGSTDFVEKQP